MDESQEEIYNNGYNAYQFGESQYSNPYTELDAEFWSDGWSDAEEDESQRQRTK